MTDALIFILVFSALLLLRITLATVVFFWVLPEGDRCPCCDSVTIRMESDWARRLPALRLERWFRKSWCYECEWHGMLRTGPLTPVEHSEPVQPSRRA